MASLQRQAPAPDAGRQVVAERREQSKALVELISPPPGQPLPVALIRGAALRQRRQRLPDLLEGQADSLRDPDEREPTEHVSMEPSLVPRTSGGLHQAGCLVEPQRGVRNTRPPDDLADAQLVRRFRCPGHVPSLDLKITRGLRFSCMTPDTAVHDLDDQRLVEHAARAIGVPRREVLGDRFSFVLHAPLELLARAALLPQVAPRHRDLARRRIVALAQGYEASGPPLDHPPGIELVSNANAATTLRRAIDDGDRPTVDAAAAWLGGRARPNELVHLLEDGVVDRLAAAGHGNIYLALLSRTQPRGLPGQMLRHPVAALASDPDRRIQVPEVVSTWEPAGAMAQRLLDVLCDVKPIGPPPSSFIAPLVEHAQAHGVFEALTNAAGAFEAPDSVPHAILRFAAQAMLQGPTAHAPYGWTHCLTLAQAPLLMAEGGGDRPRATYVAAAYLAAHWAGLGEGTVALDLTPEPTDVGLAEALFDEPARAAAAAWHASDTARTAAQLATAASVNHDAHRVKYTLACLDAAASDPNAARLYLAAAAHLNAWWHAHPDTSDPLSTQVPR